MRGTHHIVDPAPLIVPMVGNVIEVTARLMYPRPDMRVHGVWEVTEVTLDADSERGKVRVRRPGETFRGAEVPLSSVSAIVGHIIPTSKPSAQ